MKILICSATNHNNLFNFDKVFADLCIDIFNYSMDEFDHKFNYWARKVNKLGIKEIKKIYYQDWNYKLLETYNSYRPDIILFINGCEIIDEKTFEILKSKTKLAVWFIDGVKRDLLKKLDYQFKYYDYIFTFEEQDVLEIKKVYGLEAYFCPLGYNKFAYYPVEMLKDIDIIFVGMGSEKRIKILNEIAQFSKKANLTFKIVGKYYSENHFWKKWQFRKKYGILYKYIENKFIEPKVVADLYRRSKICINIHVDEHDGLNPRSFDILGTKSFMLVDERISYGEDLKSGRDFIVYRDSGDLINKINYYLNDKYKREKIANSGYNQVKSKMSITELINEYMIAVFKGRNK